MNECSVRQTADFLRGRQYTCQVVGEAERVWADVRPISDTTETSLSFVRDLRYLHTEVTCAVCGVVVVPLDATDLPEADPESTSWIFVENPEAAFYEILRWWLEKRESPMIHQSSIIHPSAELNENVTIGALCYVGPNVVIGQEVKVGVGCSLQHCVIDDEVVIQDGVKIGGDPLGVVKGLNGSWIDRPSLRGVRVGKGSRIEDNTVIQRGFLTDTHIQENVRIGPNCSLGNGVTVGRGSLVAQGVTIAGSVRIGNECAIWGNASIREGIQIGAGSTVGMGSVVLTDLPGGATYVGVPARRLW